jgi:ABC-type multidrug transport system ATPase subunit
MTTHYFHEATYADSIGFMRDGSLLIEGPPKKIFDRFKGQFNNLDEIFLHACEMKRRDRNFKLKLENETENLDRFRVEEKRRRKTNKIFKALLSQEFSDQKREPL